MSTTALTTIIEQGSDYPLVQLHRQFDGYVSGHGLALAEFLSTVALIDSTPTTSVPRGRTFAFGAGCLAARLIAKLKTEPGNFTLVSASPGQEADFTYVVVVDSQAATIKVEVFKGEECRENRLFWGSPGAFLAFVKATIQEELK